MLAGEEYYTELRLSSVWGLGFIFPAVVKVDDGEVREARVSIQIDSANYSQGN